MRSCFRSRRVSMTLSWCGHDAMSRDTKKNRVDPTTVVLILYRKWFSHHQASSLSLTLSREHGCRWGDFLRTPGPVASTNARSMYSCLPTTATRRSMEDGKNSYERWCWAATWTYFLVHRRAKRMAKTPLFPPTVEIGIQPLRKPRTIMRVYRTYTSFRVTAGLT